MPKGGFGNRLLNFLTIQNLADATNSFYFSKNYLDRERVSGINRRPILPLRLTRVTRFTRTDVFDSDFLERVRHSLAARSTVVLKPRLLANAYATFEGAAHTNTRIRMKTCAIHNNCQQEGPLVVVHLRGGDFQHWNPRSVLSADYYLRAIDIASEQLGQGQFLITTDDPSHPAMEAVQSRLSNEKRLIQNHECSTQLECDFARMVAGDLIISSPSTFAISASILGKAKVIHEKGWVEYKANLGEVFWQKVLEKSLHSIRVLDLA